MSREATRRRQRRCEARRAAPARGRRTHRVSRQLGPAEHRLRRPPTRCSAPQTRRGHRSAPRASRRCEWVLQATWDKEEPRYYFDGFSLLGPLHGQRRHRRRRAAAGKVERASSRPRCVLGWAIVESVTATASPALHPLRLNDVLKTRGWTAADGPRLPAKGQEEDAARARESRLHPSWPRRTPLTEIQGPRAKTGAQRLERERERERARERKRERERERPCRPAAAWDDAPKSALLVTEARGRERGEDERWRGGGDKAARSHRQLVASPAPTPPSPCKARPPRRRPTRAFPEDEISGRQVRRVSCASGTARTPRRWPPRDMEDAPKLTERHGVLRCYCSCWAHRGASSRRRGKRPLEAATPGRPSKDTAWEAFRQGCLSNSSGGRRWRFAKAIWRVAVAFRQGCLLFRLVRRAWATKAHAAARIPLASGGQEKPGCRFPDLSAEPLGSRPSCCSDSSGVRG